MARTSLTLYRPSFPFAVKLKQEIRGYQIHKRQDNSILSLPSVLSFTSFASGLFPVLSNSLFISCCFCFQRSAQGQLQSVTATSTSSPSTAATCCQSATGACFTAQRSSTAVARATNCKEQQPLSVTRGCGRQAKSRTASRRARRRNTLERTENTVSGLRYRGTVMSHGTLGLVTAAPTLPF